METIYENLNPNTPKVLTILFGLILLLPIAYVFVDMIIVDFARDRRIKEAKALLGTSENPPGTLAPIAETRQITDQISPYSVLQPWVMLSYRLWVGVAGLIFCLFAMALWVYSALYSQVLAQSTSSPPQALDSWLPKDSRE